MRWVCASLTLAVAVGCASARPGKFRDQPPVWSVEDTKTISEPKEREFFPLSYLSDALVFDPIADTLNPTQTGPSLDTNSLDEVPDSTWFQNRIGIRDITPDEIARGPVVDGPPQEPLTVISAKKGGANPGFLISDSRDVKYLIKFDTPENPEQQTATNVIVNRIFWALGYNVPADYVYYLDRSKLKMSDKVRKKGLDDSDIDAMLKLVPPPQDGKYRVTASQFLSGKPKGGFPATGTRPDDANDVIPHEFRRELRALQVFSAWLGHTDIKEDNTLDMYVEEDGHKFLRHYLVDFGEAFGGHQSEKDQKQIGFEYAWDFANQGKAFLALGLWVRPWERQKQTPWKSVGYFGAKYFEPRSWHPRYNYPAFHFTDHADRYWATKLIMRFDRELLAAVVAESQLSDADAAAYLVDTLVARRDKVGKAYLDSATPFDHLHFDGERLCGTDLKTKYFGTGGQLQWRVRGGKKSSVEIGSDATACVPLTGASGYTVLKLRIRRKRGGATPWMHIHVVADGQPHIVGIVR